MRFVALLCLAAGLQAADQKATVAALQSRIAAQERALAEMRAQLDVCRSQTYARVDTARSGLEVANRALEGRLAQAQTETAAAQAVTASKEQVIRELTVQIDRARERTSTDSAAAAIAATAETAVNTAVKVATTRNTRASAGLKSATALAGTAAGLARQAAMTGEDNRRILTASQTEIERLTGIIGTQVRGDVVSRRLTVIVAVLLVLLFGVVMVRFRK
jgi:hypothetical protein